MAAQSMRERFVETSIKLLESDPKVVLVLAEISVSAFNNLDLGKGVRDRIINVGIREQLMVGVAAGLAKEGFLPIVHTYAPFLVERAYEQLKLDFSHQGVRGVFVSIGASYDAASSGRTHQAPADVALIRTLPDWNIFVPGHPDEAEASMRQAILSNQCSYIRLSEETNKIADIEAIQNTSIQKESSSQVVVIAVGPVLDPVLSAVEGLNVTVLYAPAVHTIGGEALRQSGAKKVVLVEPYIAGTSAAAVSDALSDRPHRLLSLGVKDLEKRQYGTPKEHAASHELDEAGLQKSIGAFYRA
jgi:transketolase